MKPSTGRLLVTGLLVATGLLASALAYTYRIYTLAEEGRRRQADLLDRTVDRLERAHRARLRVLLDSRRQGEEIRATHRTLADAYRGEASRMLAAGRLPAARIFAAASLLHDPGNPLSPYRSSGAARGSPPRHDPEIASAQSVLYEVAVRGIVHHLHTPPRLGFRVWATAFSPDGRLLAVAGDSRKVRLWDVTASRWTGHLMAPAMPVFDLAFSPDGKLLAAATNAGKVRVWTVRDRKRVATMDAHSTMALTVRFSPNGHTLASGGMDGMIRLWDARDGRALARKASLRETGGVWDLAFSPNGNLLASAAWHQARSRVRLWSLRDHRAFASYTGHLGPVWALAFSPDGRYLASGGLDRQIRILSARKLRLRTTLKHHRADVTSLAFSPNGRWLVSGSMDKSVAVWRTSTWRPISSLRPHARQIWSVRFDHSGRLLATAGWDRRVRIWRVGRGDLRPVSLHPPPSQRSDPFVAVWCGARSNRLVAQDSGNNFHLWALGSGKKPSRHLARRHLLPAHLRRVAISPDGEHVAAPGARNAVWVWPLRTASRPIVLRGSRSSVGDLAFGPKGDLLATLSRTATLRVWSWRRRKELDRMEGLRGPVAFSPDGALLATSDSKGRIRLLRVKDLADHRTIPASTGSRVGLERLVWSPGGKQLLAVREDQTMVLWDLGASGAAGTGKKLAILAGHTDEILGASFSPNGRYLLSSSRDRTVRIWDLSTGRELQRMTLPRPVQRACFTHHGRRFAVPTAEGVTTYPLRLRLWRVPPRRLLRGAEAAAGLKLDGLRLTPAP